MLILSIDGGGLMGIAPAKWLTLHQDRAIADLYCGTSTGAIIAAGLACGFLPKYIFNLFLDLGKKVFQDSVFDDIEDLGHLVGARYSHNNLRDALTPVFGNRMLGDAPCKLLIPTFDLVNYKSKVYTNTRKNDADLEVKLVDVIGASCSAPTYFPTWFNYVDGGCCANNPAMCGITEALFMREKLDNISLLSLSTYDAKRSIGKKAVQDWGLAQWASTLPDILISGPADIVDFQCRQILKERYERVTFSGNKLYKLDSLNALSELPILVEQLEGNVA